MKDKKKSPAANKPLEMKTNVRNLLKSEGKMIHGTFGKPTHGARGNKKF